jgi:glycosyltransferase involved in cell wall biosynthesis
MIDLPNARVPSAALAGWPWTGDSLSAPLGTGGKLPRISVVTPSYNQGRFLEATIRSVLMQGYPDLEYFVIDGGSNDETADVLAAYAPYLTGVVSEPDDGQADGVNKGLRMATGEVMGWLNSDDLLLPGALWNVGQAFAERADVDIVCGFRRYIDGVGTVLHNGVHERPSRRTLSHYCYVGQETVYWRRGVWDAIGPLDVAYRYALDFEYWHRALAAGFEFELLPVFLGAFRLHDESKGALLDDVREEEMRRVYRYYLGRDESFVEMHRALGWGWRARRMAYRVLRDTFLFERPGLARLFTSVVSAHSGRAAGGKRGA